MHNVKANDSGVDIVDLDSRYATAPKNLQGLFRRRGIHFIYNV